MQSHDLFMLTIRPLKHKQKQHLTARAKCRHFQQRAERDGPSAQANRILNYAIARIAPLVLNRSKPFCADDGRREDRRSQ